MASEAKHPTSGEGGGAAAMAAIQRPGGWVPDERDGFISWLRGEFAAANAIIDALCGHLQMCWPGEYDLVLACIQQRRFNWSPILHMQHYYSVAEVLMALQQVNLTKHQAHVPGIPVNPGSGSGSGSSSVPASGETARASPVMPPEGNPQQHVIEDPFLASKVSSENKKPQNNLTEDSYLTSKVSSLSIGEEPSNSFPAANASRRHLVGIEEVQGEQVNVLEGLELHDNVFHTSAAAEMIELVAESKRKAPKVSAAIQFGTIPSDIVPEEPANGPKDEVVEGKIPPYLQSVIERLVNLGVIYGDKRPDSCSITLLKPGEFMRLQSYLDFEQPLYMLSLGSDSSLTFGRNMKRRDLFCLTLPLGSVLVLQGRSLEAVQVAVSPSHSHRAIVTLGRVKASGPKTSPDSRHRDGHAFHEAPGGVIVSPARSPVHFPISTSPTPSNNNSNNSSNWATSSARGLVLPTPPLGTGVFLPANGAPPIFTTSQLHQHQHQMQMNGLHQRRPGVLPPPAPAPSPQPHLAPPH